MAFIFRESFSCSFFALTTDTFDGSAHLANLAGLSPKSAAQWVVLIQKNLGKKEHLSCCPYGRWCTSRLFIAFRSKRTLELSAPSSSFAFTFAFSFTFQLEQLTFWKGCNGTDRIRVYLIPKDLRIILNFLNLCTSLAVEWIRRPSEGAVLAIRRFH